MMAATANRIAERVNIEIINSLSARRALIGVGRGARSPAGAARAAVEFCETKGTAPARHSTGGTSEVSVLVAPLTQTTRRRLPALLSRLSESDPRRIAAEAYALAVEKVGSVAGASAEGAKADGGPASNDGGVTTRIRYAATITAVERTLDHVGAVLTPNAQGGGTRREIRASDLMAAICLDARDMKSILTNAGWSGQRRDVARLNRRADLCLELMARVLGIVPAGAGFPQEWPDEWNVILAQKGFDKTGY